MQKLWQGHKLYFTFEDLDEYKNRIEVVRYYDAIPSYLCATIRAFIAGTCGASAFQDSMGKRYNSDTLFSVFRFHCCGKEAYSRYSEPFNFCPFCGLEESVNFSDIIELHFQPYRAVDIGIKDE